MQAMQPVQRRELIATCFRPNPLAFSVSRLSAPPGQAATQRPHPEQFFLIVGNCMGFNGDNAKLSRSAFLENNADKKFYSLPVSAAPQCPCDPFHNL